MSNGAEKPAILPGQMPGNLPENAPQPRDFDPVGLSKLLLRTIRVAALGTLDRNTGHPVTTLVSAATDLDGAPLLLTSGLSSHTANMVADRRISVLLAKGGKGDALAHPRLTVLGEAEMVEGATRERVRQRFLSLHPKAELYADFPDFRFWRMRVASGHLNGGFARAADLAASELLTAAPPDLAMLEPSALSHLNHDHADALTLYAEKLAGEAAGRWQAVALDAEGLTLMLGEKVARIGFESPVHDGITLRDRLAELAAKARNI